MNVTTPVTLPPVLGNALLAVMKALLAYDEAELAASNAALA